MRIILFTALFPALTVAQGMLADIQKDVQTPFGVYRPRLVAVVPDAAPYDVGKNLEHVVNLDRFSFSPEQLSLLKKNGFVVTPALRGNRTGYNEVFDLYTDCRENGLPQFITTDAMLHGFHLMFNRILKTCEEKRFISLLDDLLAALEEKTRAQYEAAADKMVREALFRNLDYLLVASQLLNPKFFFTDPLPGGKYGRELELILEAQARFVDSPIFGYPEDYTQYKPRGHYTRSEALQRYFRCMMWLGRMTFSCEQDREYDRSMTLSAILLVQALTQARVGSTAGTDVWEDIYQPTVFFVGQSDDLHYADYLSLGYSIYGKSFPIYIPDTFADAAKLSAFRAAAEKIAAPHIGYPGQPVKGFRFMGQRFVPDSWILDELVYNKTRDRWMPTGLDVMIVLGPQPRARQEWAFQHLPKRDKTNVFYVAKLDSLKKIFRDYPDEIWAQNAYWNWLYCLMPLQMPKGAGYPFFMRTDAWRDKDLHAALASWAELRHDTILYVKQSGTERGLPPTAAQMQGYVEPNPHLFARLASLADFMIEGLNSRNLLFEEFRLHLNAFAELSARLADIAEKELSRRRLSSEDDQLIFDFGKILYNIITFQPYLASEGPPRTGDDLEPMPVIADVHTDANSGLVLEEGVGFPYAVYVICNIEGRPMIAKGACFSYYEFTHPANDRLTDEQWRKMLISDAAPQPLAWIHSFFSGTENPRSAEFAQWNKPGSTTVAVNLPERVQCGSTFDLTFSILNDWDDSEPGVRLFLPNGGTIPLAVVREAAAWRARISTENSPSGTAYIHIEKRGGDQTLLYRIRFEILPSSSVNDNLQPSACVVRQNFPNPFNGNTLFIIELPAACHVRFEIYDLNGRLKAVLFDQNLPAGIHHISWDGFDEKGATCPSGVYLCRSLINNTAITKRMVLMK